jgi:hypothetical protein
MSLFNAVYAIRQPGSDLNRSLVTYFATGKPSRGPILRLLLLKFYEVRSERSSTCPSRHLLVVGSGSNLLQGPGYLLTFQPRLLADAGTQVQTANLPCKQTGLESVSIVHVSMMT